MNLLGAHHDERGELDVAAMWFERALEFADLPDRPQVQVNLARTLVAIGRIAEAVVLLQEVAAGSHEEARARSRHILAVLVNDGLWFP